jgi:hypothetical protein
MAINSTTVNLSDTFATLVAKTNNLVTDAGNFDSDITALDARLTSADSDLGVQIDSAVSELSNSLSGDIGTLSNLTTADKTNLVSAINELQVEVTLQSDSAGGILFDSAELSFSLAPNAITSSRFKNVESLQILDTSGSVLKTLYSPGE